MFQDKNSFLQGLGRKLSPCKLANILQGGKILLSSVPDETFNFMSLRGYKTRENQAGRKDRSKVFQRFPKENTDMKSSHISPGSSFCV